MAILAFQKPDEVIMLEGTDTSARFEFRPLEPGYATTIGNAIRRVLLSSLEGFAISSVRVAGVQQEFATIPGVIEGMQDIILNLKQVRFKRRVESVESEEVSIVISGRHEFTAGDISNGLSSFTVLNPDLHICSLEPSVKLEINLVITKGRGFSESDLKTCKAFVIIDETVASSFGNDSPIGKTIDLMGTPFVVIGVVSQKSQFEPVINSIEEYICHADDTG